MRLVPIKEGGKPADEAARATVPVEGTVRLDKRTKDLVKRLRPGEIAVIDHDDIDRVSAESLVDARPAIIINAASSITGKYPTLGPLTILTAGIDIVDDVGQALFDLVKEGAQLRVEGGVIYLDKQEVARGQVLTVEDIEERLERGREKLGRQLGDFAANTMELLEAEKDILLESIELPNLTTEFAGQHALVVVRGHEYKKDLKALRPYIREVRPVLVGVDGGADALLDIGLKPKMIVGDMDSVTDKALRCGAELVVHGFADGRAPGKVRLDEMGLPSTVFYYPGTSEDIAMLIAYEKGAELITILGGHTNLIEYLDKGRRGMSSTFLVRLRVGSILVDAKGISRLYQPRVRGWYLLLMVLAALITITIIIIFSEPVRQFITLLAMRLQVWLMKLQSLI